MNTTRFPNFICVGPGRTGTSWLREMLESHPDISLSTVKETEYFNNNFDKGDEWYKSHFSNQGSVCGEISNMYYLDNTTPEKIKTAIPTCKIIFAIREPRSLLMSFYKFGIRRGVATKQLMDALDQPVSLYMGSGYNARKVSNALTPGDHVNLLDSVLLSSYIDRYVQHFGSDSVFILPFEQLADSSEAVLENVYEFLGVDKTFKPQKINEIVNPSLLPRSKLLAKLAHNTAFVLRHLGLYRVLSALHKSRLLKTVLFRQNADTNENQDFNFSLQPHVENALEADYDLVLKKSARQNDIANSSTETNSIQ